MSRIPEPEIGRIRDETDLVALVRSRGVALERRGDVWVGACPFHDESGGRHLSVAPGEGRFSCTARSCGRSGDAIRFVEWCDGVSYRHAFELLASGAAAHGRPAGGAKRATATRLECPLATDAGDDELMAQVVNYYHGRLALSEDAKNYLALRGLDDGALVERFRIGFADRTLGLRLPHKNRSAGAKLRASLARLGVYRKSGHEHLTGCVVVPIPGRGGGVRQLYGRRIGPKVPNERRHLYLEGPARRREPNHKGYDTTRHIRGRSKDKRSGGKPAWQPEGEPGTLEGEAWRYLDHLAVRNYSPGTIAGTRDKLKRFLEWADTRPKEITMAILESYQRDLHRHRKKNGKPLTATTQRSHTTAVKLYFAWMTKRKLIAANPASELELPRPEKRLHEEALSIAQIDAVLNVPDIVDPLGLRDRTMLELLYSTGLRRAELAAVAVTDVNHERGTLRVRQGKGKKDRVVPVGASALGWVSRYLDHVRPKLALETSEKAMFLTSYGEAFHPDVLSRIVSKFIRKAEIGRTGSCHLIRHTCATHMLEGGADIRYIQQLLGHEKLETTAIYTEVSIAQLKEIHARSHPAEKCKRIEYGA